MTSTSFMGACTLGDNGADNPKPELTLNAEDSPHVVRPETAVCPPGGRGSCALTLSRLAADGG